MARYLLTHTPVRQALSIGLGVFAVALVFGLLLYASSNPAGADNSPPPIDDGGAVSERPVLQEDEETPTPTPRVHATPEACPTNPAEVVSSGHYPLFEAYWDPDDDDADGKNLTGNLCPPSVEHVKHTETDSDGKEVITYTTSRGTPTFKVSDDKHDVISTIHVPNTARMKHTLAASATRIKTTTETPTETTTSYNAHTADDMDRYPFAYPTLGNPDSKSKTTSTVGTTTTTVTTETYNRKSDYGAEIWALPYCEPEDDYYTHVDGDLCLGFSAGLLDPSDWIADPAADTEAPGQVQYHFESIREPGLHADDRGYVFVYYPHDVDEDEDGNAVTAENRITWRTDRTNTNRMYITPGTYQHRTWAFSKQGPYQLQVHALGYPSKALKREAGISNESATSVVRFYNFHVGLMADLEVAVSAKEIQLTEGGTADLGDLEPGDKVQVTITATNKGPDASPATKVDFDLPLAIYHPTVTVPTGTSEDTVEGQPIWTIGNLAAPTTTTVDGVATTTYDSKELTITGTIVTGTRGQSIVVGAKIYGTETIGSSTVHELDPDTGNNTASATIAPVAVDNTNPVFGLERSIAENSGPGAKVGGPIAVIDPNSGDTLTYGLIGTGNENFSVNSATGGIQIVVADGVYLNYEDASSYNLALTVSDGKDEYGNADTTADDTIPVAITVTDDTSETLTATLSVSPTSQTVNGDVTFTVTVTENPGKTSRLSYTLTGRNTDPNNLDIAASSHQSATFTESYGTAGTRKYYATLTVTDDSNFLIGSATTGAVAVNWTAQ